MKELKCLVCGMMINANNYKLNEYSFVEKNQIHKIINCPFCGVGKSYLDYARKEYELEKNALDEGNLKILEKAMKLEVFNSLFYEEASKMANSESLRWIFLDLSRIELMHARIHMRLADYKTLPELHKPDYARHDTDELLLQEAYKRENHAVRFYEKNVDQVSDKVLKEIFIALSYVEKQHVFITSENNR